MKYFARVWNAGVRSSVHETLNAKLVVFKARSIALKS